MVTLLAPLSILLVERDPHVRQLAKHFLSDEGHEVETATDGLEAIVKVRLRRPDLLITEILVPKLDGLALCRQLKADPETRSIYVLVLSILAAAARSKEAGADGFMLKPLAQSRLIAMVQELATQRSARQHAQESR